MWHFLGTVPEPFYSWLNSTANAWIRFRHPERIVHPGTLHPDKTFYVIRDLPYHVGLAGWYDRVLGYMIRARKKGWIPIVDHRPDPKAGDPKTGRGNWYSYFTGVSEYNPDDINGFANVVFAVMQGVIHKRYNRAEIARRSQMCGLAKLNDRASSFVESRYKEMFPQGSDGYVGVYFR